MIKCVIFDMDGTLADTLPLCIESFRKTIENFRSVRRRYYKKVITKQSQ